MVEVRTLDNPTSRHKRKNTLVMSVSVRLQK